MNQLGPNSNGIVKTRVVVTPKQSDTVEIIQATFEEIHPVMAITAPNIPS